MVYVEFIKNSPLADSSELMTVRLISASWAKNVWFQLSRHDVPRVHEKFPSHRFERPKWLLDSFWPPGPKNVWFLHCRLDLRRVHEKFSARPFERADGCYTHFGLLSLKTFDSYFLNMRYVEFMKNFLLADSSELTAVRLISACWAQKRLIPSFYTCCPSSSRKILLSRFEQANGC